MTTRKTTKKSGAAPKRLMDRFNNKGKAKAAAARKKRGDGAAFERALQASTAQLDDQLAARNALGSSDATLARLAEEKQMGVDMAKGAIVEVQSGIYEATFTPTTTGDFTVKTPFNAPVAVGEVPVERAGADRVAAETAIITMRCKKPSARRSAKDGSVEVKSAVEGGAGDPDEDSTRVSVDLLRADEYLAIVRHDIQTRRYLMDAALPAGRRLASGSYLVLVAKVEEIYEKLAERKREREALVDKFLEAYPAIVEDACERLKDAFDVKMFPGATMKEEPATGRIYVDVDDRAKALMSTAFSMEYELEVTDREAGLRAAKGSLSKAFVERELRRAKASAQLLADEIRDGMRVAFAQLIDKATEMLKPEAGEKKVFRGEALDRINEFLGAFATRNVAGDSDLAQLVEQARGVLKGVDVEALRDAKDKAPRVKLGEALAQVQANLKTLVTTPRRKITLGEEG